MAGFRENKARENIRYGQWKKVDGSYFPLTKIGIRNTVANTTG